MRDYIQAIKDGATNEDINSWDGTEGRDYIGAYKDGATNEDFNTWNNNTEEATKYNELDSKESNIDTTVSTKQELTNNKFDSIKSKYDSMLNDGSITEEQYNAFNNNLELQRIKANELNEVETLKNEVTTKKLMQQASEMDKADRDKILNSKDAIDRTLDTTEGMARGSGRMFLGLGKLGQDAVNNLSDSEYKAFDVWIKENEDVIKDKGLEGSAMVGEVLANILPVARLKSLGYIATSEGVMTGLSSLGKGEEYSDAGTKAVVSGATSAVAGKIINRLFPNLPSKEIDTNLKKNISKLDADDQKRINGVLDVLDSKGIKNMDNTAREAILSDIITTNKTSAEISDTITRRLSAQAKVAKKKVANKYSEANEIASKIPVDKKIEFTYKPKGKSEAKTYTEAKEYLKPKYNKTVEELESTISELGTKIRGSQGTDKYIYTQAKKSAQDMQDSLGGKDIYKEARNLSKQYNTEYSGVIKEGQEATAGATTARAINKDFSEEIGTMLVGKDIDPNKIGVAVKGLKEKQKQMIVEDVLSKNLPDKFDYTPENVNTLLSNYKSMNKKGISKLIGEQGRVALDKQMKALQDVELAIKSAKGSEIGIADDVLALAGAGATAKLSPYLALRSSMYASKNIIKKMISKKERNELIARTRKIENNKLRATLMRAIGLSLSSLANTNKEEE